MLLKLGSLRRPLVRHEAQGEGELGWGADEKGAHPGPKAST